jgi:hypothetical protein
LLPLLIRDAPSKPAAETLKRFSKLATLCVIAITAGFSAAAWLG